ncbi:MAG: DUF5309 family protein [Thermoleophilia bacterium]
MAGQGIQQSYSATLPQKRMVTDRIILADPMSIAGLNALGLHNESKFSFVNTPGRSYEWLEDTYLLRSDTAADVNLTSVTTTTTIAMTDGTKFNIGDVIQIDSEYMWVSAISTNTLTVTRDFGGTQATHASTSTVYIRYNSRLEGAAVGTNNGFTEPTTGYNYSAILQKPINVSRTNALIPQYGISGVVEREIDKAMDELLMKLNLSLYHGQRAVGTTSTPRSLGGLAAFVTTNPSSASSAALTQKMIEDEVQQCFDAGGSPDLILCNSWAKRKIGSFFDGYVRTERDETRGGIVIDKMINPIAGGEIDVVVDRHCPTNFLWLIDRRYVGFITIDDFFYEELGKLGDSAPGGYGEVVGEYGLVVAFEKAHSNVNTFLTTA